MGVGHAAVAIGAVRVAPRVNAGWLVFAALLADFLLGIFVLMGLEHAHVPPDYAIRHYMTFTFPYSHGLASLLLWGAIFGLVASRTQRLERTRVFFVVAAVIVSHFVLDGLVHVAGLPLAGENSPKIGLALWNHLPLELTLEALMAAAGVVVYLKVAGPCGSAWSRLGIPIFMALFTALTWTQLFTARPLDLRQLAFTWIAGPLLFGAAVYVLDRQRVASHWSRPKLETR